MFNYLGLRKIMTAQGLLYSAPDILNRLCVAGINHCKANTSIRGLFAVDDRCYELILRKAKELGLKSTIVLSTCNRIEIYGYVHDINILIDLLTSYTHGSREEFLRHAYLKSGESALQHLYHVATGLDSQILGDHEILGQLKRSVECARRHGAIGPIMDRTLNYVIQASKKVKKHTSLSSGTVSVSYAVVELLEETPEILNKKVLLIGAGKIGKSVCKNLKDHLKVNSIKILNRTEEAARELADNLNLDHASFETLPQAVKESDVIILCTNAESPIILPQHISADCPHKLIIDLSVPVNVHSDIRKLKRIRVIDVDEISTAILDKTLAMRKAEIPKANDIIDEHKNRFWEWLLNYKDALHLRFWKKQLNKLNDSGTTESLGEVEKNFNIKYIQKAINRLATELREQDEKGCLMIKSVNEYLKDVRPDQQ